MKKLMKKSTKKDEKNMQKISNEINSFTFYRDYFNLIDTIPLKDKKELLIAIVDYVFKDEEPLFNGHNQAIFNTLKAQLNKSKNNSERRTKKEPNENQKETKKKPNDNPNKNKTSILSFKFYIYNSKYLKDRELLRGKIEEWVNYKLERKETYKETGFKSLLSEIESNVEKFGEQQVIDLITNSMANNYKGIIFDKLKKEQPKKTASEKRQEMYRKAEERHKDDN